MPDIEFQILYEDKYLLAVNKPHGLVTEKEPHLKFTLESVALNYLRNKEKYPQKCFIGVPHRLDRPVSGVVLLAKKKGVLKQLVETFAKRQIQKTYLAIVENKPANEVGELEHWLVKDVIQRKAIIHDTQVPNAMRVLLRYKLVRQHESGFLLKVELITGKFHQIRAQLSHIGCPIVGDIFYGSGKTYKDNAICLHALQLQLQHPITNEPLTVSAPLPTDGPWIHFQ